MNTGAERAWALLPVEIRRLRAAAERRYQRRVAAAAEDRRRDLAALDRLQRRCGPADDPPAPGPYAMALGAAAGLAGTFDVSTLLAAILSRHPGADVTRNAVQKAVYLMRTRGLLGVLEQGHQHRSGAYRWADERPNGTTPPHRRLK